MFVNQSIEGFFVLILVASAGVFMPLLAIPVIARLKGKTFEWGAYLVLGSMSALAAMYLIVQNGLSFAVIPGVLMIAGTALIVLAPAYAIVWWVTGKMMSCHRRSRGTLK